MSKRYPGNFITGNPVALSQTSNNGVWDLKDNYAAVGNDTWQAAGSGSYEIPRSLRFRRSATTYLTKVAGTPTSQNIWTISMWVKLGLMADATSTNGGFFSANQVGNPTESIKWGGMGEGNGAKIYYQAATSGGTNNITRFIDYAFRDPSAWYHLVFQKNGSCNSGVKFWSAWINGVQVAYFSGGYTGTQASVPDYINTTGSTFNIGGIGAANTLDCHMAEVNFVDGQALDASYFGYTDSVNGIWQPKKYTGAYGNNGFYLPFSENFSTTNLGRNFAGSNHLTYSQAGTDASYTYNNASGSANFTTAPDGTFTATKLTIDSSNTTHRFYKQYTVLTSGAVAVVSAYVKALPGSAYNVVALENWTGSAGGQAYFNLTTGEPQYAAAWPAGSGYQHVGNGWYRIWTTFANATSNGSGSPSIGIYMVDNSNGLTYTGNGTAGFYFWGVQVNLGTTPDNYIATTSAASINNFTLNNFSVTAGATNDSMVDSPTNVFTTATDIGGVISGNYCTLSPVNRSTGGGTLSEGNLRITSSGGNHTVCGTIAFPTSGKWYFEATDTVTGGNSAVGIFQQNQSLETNIISANINLKYNNMADAATFGFAVDMDSLTYTWYKNNTVASTGSASTGSLVAGVTYVPCCMTSAGGGASTTFNFGQRPFAYAPPTGYKSLNTTNLQALGSTSVGSAAIKPNKWFDTVLYGGTGAARTITNPGGFVPDLVWTKVRNTTYSHNLVDSARGAGVRSSTDANAVEGANVNGGVTSFNTTNNNGYNIDGGVEVNENGRPYVSWQWKASPTSGLNIVTYTGTGALTSISHNLGVAPKMIMIKRRNVAGNWSVYHASLASVNHSMYMNSTNPQASDVNTRGSAPTSSSFSVGTDLDVNQINTLFVAYLFAEVPGFSKFGSYTGNGAADGTFVYTGFRPRFVLIRAFSTGLRDWLIYDSERNTYNVISQGPLQPNIAGTPYGSGYYGIDMLSNGFKLRESTTNMNASGESHLYMCFAESPFALNNRAR